MILKKLAHRHKYTELKIYPPRPEYGKNKWGFLETCACGHAKPAKVLRSVEVVTTVFNDASQTPRQTERTKDKT